MGINILYSRLIGTIFSIFAGEKLGYDVALVDINDMENNNEPFIDTDSDNVFRKLSSCKNEL